MPAELAAIYRPRPSPFWLVSQGIARIEVVLREGPESAMFPPLPEAVTFEEVAAILDEAAPQGRGGPPHVISAAGWHWANSLSAAGLHVVRAPADARQLTF